MRRRWLVRGSRLARPAWFAAAVCLACWIGSYVLVLWFGVAPVRGWGLHHQWIDGRIECVLVHQPTGSNSKSGYFTLRGRDRLSSVIAITTNNHQHPVHRLLGFTWGRVDKPTGPRGNLTTSSYVLAVPWWFVTMAFVVVALSLQRRGHNDIPTCPRCGYDLRGTPGIVPSPGRRHEQITCPECGEPIPIPSRSLTSE